MGIKTVWVIDPETRRADIYGESPAVDVNHLTVADSAVYVDLDHIFALYDEEQAGSEPLEG